MPIKDFLAYLCVVTCVGLVVWFLALNLIVVVYWVGAKIEAVFGGEG